MDLVVLSRAHPFVSQDVLRAMPGVAKGTSFGRLHPHFDGVEGMSCGHVRSTCSCASESVFHRLEQQRVGKTQP